MLNLLYVKTFSCRIAPVETRLDIVYFCNGQFYCAYPSAVLFDSFTPLTPIYPSLLPRSAPRYPAMNYRQVNVLREYDSA